MTMINFIKVLLPAPECPVKKAISPAGISKLTRDKASLPPSYLLLT
jgi:hypothetical protein